MIVSFISSCFIMFAVAIVCKSESANCCNIKWEKNRDIANNHHACGLPLMPKAVADACLSQMWGSVRLLMLSGRFFIYFLSLCLWL